MRQKRFTMFTKDVVGEQSYLVHTAPDRCQVIPAGGAEIPRGHGAAVARFKRACRDALMEAKVDRAVELMERITAARSRPIHDAEGAGPNPWELMAGKILSAEELDAQRMSADAQARICAEAEAAYAARNPHRRGLYENEDKVTNPADQFADRATVRRARDTALPFETRCRSAEAAYAARNPHKRKEAAT